ncbi:Kinesin-like protein [Plasmodiophora brassicae]|uniref:Kinesin-like protein n=2 Tax=Plasmodiophora brassicae TaxID=37360 RepID=A0A3P3YB89_PLABS|nr:unnamed protein product [Plasmodiophora brassicae]
MSDAREEGAAVKQEKHAPYLAATMQRAKTFLGLIRDVQGSIDPPGRSSHNFAKRDTLVVARVRPRLQREIDAGLFCVCLPQQSPKDRVVRVCQPKFDLRRQPSITVQSFDVDLALDETASTDDVYDQTCAAVVKYALDEGIGTVLSYGQTGSGKTFTMMGVKKRAARDIFAGCGDRPIALSFLEIYGKRCTDLLSEGVVQIREDFHGDVHITGLTEHPVADVDALLALIDEGERRRMRASTQKNDCSSRAHTVCRVRVGKSGVLYLCDLAGSERNQDSSAHNRERTDEMKMINASLMTLKECIRARDGGDKTAHVPFRRSPLTFLLKDVFAIESNSVNKTTVIVTVSPTVADYHHSVSTLRYASSMASSIRKQNVRKLDPRSPNSWSHEQACQEIEKRSRGKVSGSRLLKGGENGLAMMRMPEATFIKRCVSSTCSDKFAKHLYQQLWKACIDYR